MAEALRDNAVTRYVLCHHLRSRHLQTYFHPQRDTIMISQKLFPVHFGDFLPVHEIFYNVNGL